MSAVEGNCFCQSVKYRVEDVEPVASVCHCGFCRRLHGSDYTTFVSVPSEKFRIMEGQEVLTSYKASDHVTTHFCSRCGTTVCRVDSRYANSSMLRGTITSPLEIEIKKQWFKDNKVPSLAE